MVEARAWLYPCDWCSHRLQALPRASFCCHRSELEGVHPLSCNFSVDRKHRWLSVTATDFSRSTYCHILRCFPNKLLLRLHRENTKGKYATLETVHDSYCGKRKSSCVCFLCERAHTKS